MKTIKALYLLGIPLVCGSCTMINDTMYAMQENQDAIRRSTATLEESIRLGQEANEKIKRNLAQLDKINQKLRESTEEAK